MISADIQQETLASPTGASLHVYSARPEGEVKAVVVICHGLSEHAARYVPFMQELADAGLASFAADHRGHGKTVVPGAAPRTFAEKDGAAKVLDDVAAVRAEASKCHPDAPLIVFGHSMGGMIAINHAMDHPDGLGGLVVANSDLRGSPLLSVIKAILGWQRFRKGSDAEETIIKSMTFDTWNKQIGENRTDADWLSRDKAQVDAYVADPDCGWAPTVSMWRDLFRFIENGADDKRLAKLPFDLPVLLIGGGNDPATRNGAAMRELCGRMNRVGMTDVTLRIDEEDRHETLNEVGREKAVSDIISWMHRAIGAGEA